MNRVSLNTKVRPSLPTMLTSFVGRKREIADIAQLLASSPVVSLVGTGGCGKTRIALRVAAEVSHHFADGIVWIELARLADAALVPQAVAKNLNLVETPERSLSDALLNALHDKQM